SAEQDLVPVPGKEADPSPSMNVAAHRARGRVGEARVPGVGQARVAAVELTAARFEQRGHRLPYRGAVLDAGAGDRRRREQAVAAGGQEVAGDDGLAL